MPEQPFDSEAGYRAAIDAVLAAAGEEIRILDRNLGRMELESPHRADLLSRFLSGDRHRRLRLLLHDCDLLDRHSPRLLALLRRFGHVIEVRHIPDHYRHLSECQVLADHRHGALRFHADHPRGVLVADAPDEIHPWWQRFDDLWEQSHPSTPATTLGI